MLAIMTMMGDVASAGPSLLNHKVTPLGARADRFQTPTPRLKEQVRVMLDPHQVRRVHGKGAPPTHATAFPADAAAPTSRATEHLASGAALERPGEHHAARAAAPSTSSSITCDGTVTGIQADRVGDEWTTPLDLAADDTGVVAMSGCFPDGTVFSWSTGAGATVIGSDARANVVTGNVSSIYVQGCALPPGGVLNCASTSVALAPARASISVTSVTTTADYGYGKVHLVQGVIEDAPASPRVLVFKHTDVFYLDSTSVSMTSGGHFSVSIFAMNNVDRLVVTLVSSSFALTSAPGCNASWCFGAIDPLTGHNVPVAPDYANALAFQPAYLTLPGTDPDPQIGALQALVTAPTVPGTAQPAGLIQTDLESTQCFLYDQALAAIAFSYAGEQAAAQRILNALANLQLSNGSWYFMYNANGTSPFPAGGDVRYTGAVAWAAMAFNVYHHVFANLTYAPTVVATLGYLNGLRTSVGSTTAVRFNPTDLSYTSWDETHVLAFEHNADAYSAFLGHAANAGVDLFPGAAADLKAFMAARFNGSYFDPGVDLTWGENTVEIYLDPMTWGVLALGPDAVPYYGGLDFACDSFMDSAGYLGDVAGVTGFFDYQRADIGIPYGYFSWVEGSLGLISALNQVAHDTGSPLACQGFAASDILTSVGQLQGFDTGGALPEATLGEDPAYDSVSSTAATAWYYLANHHHNPFRPWDSP